MLSDFEQPSDCDRDRGFIEFNRFELDHDGFGPYMPIRGVVTERFELAVNLLDTDELYDLQDDAGELKTLIVDPGYAEIRNALHDSLLEWMGRTRDPHRGPH